MTLYASDMSGYRPSSKACLAVAFSPLELNHRLSAHQVAEISDNIIIMKPFIPKEYARDISHVRGSG